MLYDKSMTKPPLPRYTTTLHLTLELSAKDDEDADARVSRICSEIQDRCRKSTFKRLPGKPEITYAEWFDVDYA